MGMFDDLICEVDLPSKDGVSPAPDTRFQTKDLDNCMWQLFITADGTLEKQTYRDDGLVYNDFLKMEVPKRVKDKRVEYVDPDTGLTYHGRIRFYDYDWRDTDGNFHEGVIEYIATFTAGKLTSIELLNRD